MKKLQREKFLSILLFPILLLSSCSNNQNNLPEEKASLVQVWFPFSGYAGELMAVKEAAKNHLSLKIDAGSDNVDPIKLVASGTNTFGIAGADRVLTANAKGADLVIIGVANMQSPVVFLSKEKDHIKTPVDFKGKVIGVLTGTDTEYLYRALMAKVGMTSKDVQEVEIPFDLNTFILGKYDVRPAYIYDETVTLDKENIPYKVIKPEDYGIHFIGTVYFTKRDTIKNNPKMVQTFVNALAVGWESVIKDPKTGIDLLKEYDKTIDVERELASLEKGKDFFRGNQGKVLTVPSENWAQTQDTLIKAGALTAPLDVDKMIDLSFVNNYHSNKK